MSEARVEESVDIGAVIAEPIASVAASTPPSPVKAKRNYDAWITPLLRAIVIIALWWLGARAAASPLFPSPADVAQSAAASLKSGVLIRAIWTSALRLTVGYLIALGAGIPLGATLARSPFLRKAIGPLVLGLGAVPSICWLPLAILWFGLSETAIQVVVVLGALLPIATATESAVRHVTPTIERAARTMGASGATLLFRVTLPAAIPGILSGAKLGWTFALRSLMAGELLFVSGGLGQLLETGRDMGDTALIVAVVVVVVILARVCELALFSPIDREIARRWGTASA
ncbi:MAG: ABC transporter permease [Polyangiaceae bacterium]